MAVLTRIKVFLLSVMAGNGNDSKKLIIHSIWSNWRAYNILCSASRMLPIGLWMTEFLSNLILHIYSDMYISAYKPAWTRFRLDFPIIFTTIFHVVHFFCFQ